MMIKYDSNIGSEIIHQHGAKPEMLVQILHGFLKRYGYIHEDAIHQIAQELNLSRADVHGVVSFYHDFRTNKPGTHVIKICQAEACQAMGSRSLTSHAENYAGIKLNETSSDGSITLEPVYCLGNCACSPAIMIGQKVYGRVNNTKLEKLIDTCKGKSSCQ